MGRWRVEVSPGSPRTEDVFLHLIQVGDQTLQGMCEARASMADGAATVTFTAHDRAVALSFPAAGDVGGHVHISRAGEVLVDRPLTGGVMPQTGVAASD